MYIKIILSNLLIYKIKNIYIVSKMVNNLFDLSIEYLVQYSLHVSILLVYFYRSKSGGVWSKSQRSVLPGPTPSRTKMMLFGSVTYQEVTPTIPISESRYNYKLIDCKQHHIIYLLYWWVCICFVSKILYLCCVRYFII